MKLRMANVLFPGATTLLLVAVLAVWLIDPKSTVSINGSAADADGSQRWSALRFDVCLGGAATSGGWTLTIPYWFIAACAGIPLATRVCGRAHRSWRSECVTNLFCPDCGYDLCATPNRCPECGYRVPAPSTFRA